MEKEINIKIVVEVNGELFAKRETSNWDIAHQNLSSLRWAHSREDLKVITIEE